MRPTTAGARDDRGGGLPPLRPVPAPRDQSCPSSPTGSPCPRRWCSSASAWLIGLLPLDDAVSLDPQDHRDLVTHVTEFTVLVSLMGVGLAIDRTLDPRSWRSWRTWSPVWRLLLVAMPLTILGVAARSGGGSPGWRRRSPCCSAPPSPRPTRCWPPTCRSASRSPRTSTVARRRRREGAPRRGRRHPLRPHRRGRAQRRAGLSVRAPRPAADGRRVRPGRRRRLAGVVRRRQDRRGRRGGSGRRLAAGSPGLPGPQRQAPAGRPRGADAGAGRAAGGVRCRGAGRRLRLPGRLRLCDEPACLATTATPTSARCTEWSSGSSG